MSISICWRSPWMAILAAALALSAAGAPPAGAAAAPTDAAAQPAWVPLGPAGGPVQAVAFAPGAPATVYAGTSFAGVFRSADGGRTWQAANTGLENVAVAALAVSPGNPAVLYAVVQQPAGGPAPGLSIALSTDGGGSWQDASPAAGSFAFSFGLDPHDGTLLYAATTAGLFRTRFGQTGWSRLLGFPVQSVAVDPTVSSTIYASGGGVSKSTDGGATWAPVPGNPDPRSQVFNLLFDPARPDTLYALIFDAPFVVRTTDGGRTWVPAGLPTTPGTLARAISLAASPAGTLYLSGVYGSPRFFRSTDHGATWQQPDGGGPPDNIVQVLAAAPASAAPDGEALLAGGDLGLWRSADSGQSWQPSSLGLLAQNVESLAVASAGTVFLGVTSADGASGAGLFRGLVHGQRMRRLSQRGGEQVVADPRQPGVVYAGNQAAIYQRSVNGGATWTAVSFPEGNLVIDPTRSATLYVSRVPGSETDFGCTVWRSLDNGAHWTCIQPAFQAGFAALVVDPRQPATLYGLDPLPGDPLVRRSDDGGTTWRSATAGLAGVDAAAAIAIDPHTSVLYLATPRGLFRSTNRAGTWHLASTTLPAGTDRLVAGGSPAHLFAGVPGQGVFASADGAGAWEEVGSGLPAPAFTGLFALDPALPLTLYAATVGEGVFRLDL